MEALQGNQSVIVGDVKKLMSLTKPMGEAQVEREKTKKIKKNVVIMYPNNIMSNTLKDAPLRGTNIKKKKKNHDCSPSR